MRRAVRSVLLVLLVLVAPISGAVTVAADDGDSSGPPERWTQTVGGSDDDKLATGLKVDEGYLLVGWSNSSDSADEHDGYVVMLDESGQTKWEASYGGAGTDRLFDVEQVEDGYLLVGMATDATGEKWDGWMVKIGPEGEKQWERTYGASGDDALWSITQSDDQIYVGGWQRGEGTAEAWAMALDSNGEQTWSQTYDTVRSGANEYVNSVFVTEDGELLMTGTSRGSTADPADAWVLKVDSGNGDVKWDETYGGAKYDQVHDAVAAPNGGYVLAGRTASSGNGEQDGWMLKISPDGEKDWDRTFGTDREDSFFGIHNDPDGGYVLSGTKHVLGPEGADGWIVKTDGDGRMEWERTYGDNYWDKFWPAIEGHGGGYLAIGESTSFGESRDGWLVRIGGPAMAAIEDADENESGTTVRMDGSPVRAVTLSDSNVSGYVSVAEETNLSALSPPGDSLYAVTVDGSDEFASTSATVEFTVQNESIPTEASDLRVAQQTDEGWTLLETTVVSADNGTTVISAETDGSSTLAVTSVPAPTASIESDDVVSVGDSIELSAERSTAENGSLAEYEWVVDGESYSGETASVNFDDPGEYEVELTVTDENGLRDTETVTVLVNDDPEVTVETPDSMTVGKAGSFSADVTDEVGDVTVTWQFGNGEVTGESVEHSFGSPGTKTITVVVEDEFGATVTKEIEVQVGDQDGNVEQTTTASDNGGGVPGFGVAAALVALVAAALLARRSS